MDKVRGPFQGVLNIVRFNWHLYGLVIGVILILLSAAQFVMTGYFVQCLYLSSLILFLWSLLSLLVSYYIYDKSGFYDFRWLEHVKTDLLILNINAGFDETSVLLKKVFPNGAIVPLDFYDPIRHTEISIKRARKAYPACPGTQQISTTNLPFERNSVDKIFLIFSAHEIRNDNERTGFLKELHRILKTSGQIVVVEHLRDPVNFLAYNIGFFHFYTGSTWLRSFNSADLIVSTAQKLNPFITCFTLKKNGNSL